MSARRDSKMTSGNSAKTGAYPEIFDELRLLRGMERPISFRGLSRTPLLVKKLGGGDIELAVTELADLLQRAGTESQDVRLFAEVLLRDGTSLQRFESVASEIGYDQRHVRRITDTGARLLSDAIGNTHLDYRITRTSVIVTGNDEIGLFVACHIASGIEPKWDRFIVDKKEWKPEITHDEELGLWSVETYHFEELRGGPKEEVAAWWMLGPRTGAVEFVVHEWTSHKYSLLTHTRGRQVGLRVVPSPLLSSDSAS